MNTKIDKELIEKYLGGASSGVEDRLIYEWITESDENMAEFRRIKDARDRLGIMAAEADTQDEARRKVWKKIGRKPARRRMYAVAASVAAVLAVGIFLFGRFGSGVEGDGIAFQTERGQLKEVTLPDGSTVTLNAESKISYIFEEDRGLRLVFLTGEAFFDVVRDTLNPFVVRTDHMDARVLGTKFNISAYPDSRAVETTIMEGRVALSIHGLDADPVEVTADDRATLIKGGGSFRLDRVDASLIGQWMDGTLVFREALLGDIAGKLERYYDIPVELSGDGLYNMVYTATFDKGTPVEKILELFAFTSPIDYRVTDDRIVITLKNR